MSGKYIKEPEAIDFAAYKGKLRFTSSAVESLEVPTCLAVSRAADV
jgi:hypothetical protein